MDNSLYAIRPIANQAVTPQAPLWPTNTTYYPIGMSSSQPLVPTQSYNCNNSYSSSFPSVTTGGASQLNYVVQSIVTAIQYVISFVQQLMQNVSGMLGMQPANGCSQEMIPYSGYSNGIQQPQSGFGNYITINPFQSQLVQANPNSATTAAEPAAEKGSSWVDYLTDIAQWGLLLAPAGKAAKTAGAVIKKGWGKAVDYAEKGWDWLSSSKVGGWVSKAADWIGSWF